MFAICVFFFFFQAEDGIRDLTVTGVQTCALPISGTCPTGKNRCLYAGRWPLRRFDPSSLYRSREHRSEEHTSELQSQSNLVCRLLLEKKKKTLPQQADDHAKDHDSCALHYTDQTV